MRARHSACKDNLRVNVKGGEFEDVGWRIKPLDGSLRAADYNGKHPVLDPMDLSFVTAFE